MAQKQTTEKEWIITNLLQSCQTPMRWFTKSEEWNRTTLSPERAHCKHFPIFAFHLVGPCAGWVTQFWNDRSTAWTITLLNPVFTSIGMRNLNDEPTQTHKYLITETETEKMRFKYAARPSYREIGKRKRGKHAIYGSFVLERCAMIAQNHVKRMKMHFSSDLLKIKSIIRY